MRGGAGGRLLQMESFDENEVLRNLLPYLPESLPRQYYWFLGDFANPLSLVSTSTYYTKRQVIYAEGTRLLRDTRESGPQRFNLSI